MATLAPRRAAATAANTPVALPPTTHTSQSATTGTWRAGSVIVPKAGAPAGDFSAGEPAWAGVCPVNSDPRPAAPAACSNSRRDNS